MFVQKCLETINSKSGEIIKVIEKCLLVVEDTVLKESFAWKTPNLVKISQTFSKIHQQFYSLE